ncbi:hypothetical protein [Priestia megaterium]|uniref:hypothetical protein n=1 Tax=Priestia megaterium TaxID=1404 RepID=UPI000BF9DEF7|nr:hypothetical protein [Priestia megaterium]PFI93389.1 hypothetical protein COI84_19680 [Priestia megaterium]PGR11794.1 hypothetical protein COC62_14320 [Priestia megaterium]
MEVVKKFVSKSETRPILKYSYHRADGNIIATDSHRLIQVGEIHGFKEDYLVDPKSFMFAKGEYPDVEKINDKEKHTKSITLSKDQIKLWLQIFKSINQTMEVMKNVSSFNKVVVLKVKHNKVEVELKNFDLKMSLPCETLNIPENFEQIAFSVEYMRDALEAHFKLNSSSLNIYFKGSMVPMILDDEKKLQTLILPVRLYD